MTELVLIEWVDSHQPLSNWAHLDSLPNKKLIECASVGWLVYDGDEVKMPASNMGDMKSETNIQAAGIIIIPAVAVKRIVKLKECG